MPIYEYRCEACGHEMEVLRKISDPPLVDCPACQQPAMKKLLSAAGFRLKGGGWYETDFKKGGKKNLHDQSGASTAAKTEPAKSDSGGSKPAGGGSSDKAA